MTVPRQHVLQQLAVTAVGTASLSEVEITVDRWKPPMAGWIGRPALAGLTELEIVPKGAGVQLRLATAEPVDVGLLLAAAVRCLRPVAGGAPEPMLTLAPGLPREAAALAGRLRDVLRVGEVPNPHVRRCDVLLRPPSGADPVPGPSSTVVIERDRWVRDGEAFEVSIDPTVHRPLGRRSAGDSGIAHATLASGVVRVTRPGLDVSITGDVTARDASALRSTMAVIRDTPLPPRVERQLAACGVVLADDPATLPASGDCLAWQARSVHERRHALRQYGPWAPLDAWPTVSVVLVTNRPDHLDHALRQLGSLEYPRLEAVIGVHGDGIDAARVWDLAQQVPFPVTVVAVDGSRNLGQALQQCCDRAEGALLTKMDDDDVYGPEHVWDLVLAREYSGAQIVGKALDWIHVESAGVTSFRPTYAAEKYAHFVAGGTMLLSKGDLMSVGGWRPVPKSVDRALLDRVLADGGLVYRTHGLGYVYVRHSAGHTASVRDEHFLTKTVAQIPGMVQHAVFGTGDGAGAAP